MSFWNPSSPKENSTNASSNEVQQYPAKLSSAVKAQKAEMQMIFEFFEKMQGTCFDKCMGKMKESDLNVAEMSCVDRCVQKFMETAQKVTAGFTEQAMQQMQQQQSQQ